jgi:hypothetical protein
MSLQRPREASLMPDADDDVIPEHDCPKQAFLDNHITKNFGITDQMVGFIPCPVCDTVDSSNWYPGSSRSSGPDCDESGSEQVHEIFPHIPVVPWDRGE